MNTQFESTYSMLVRSEEKGRGILEILVYAAIILSVVFSIWQFAATTLQLPLPRTDPCPACDPPKSQLPAHSSDTYTPLDGQAGFRLSPSRRAVLPNLSYPLC